MAKVCTPIPRQFDPPCIQHSGMQCEGDRYALYYEYDFKVLQQDGSYLFFYNYTTTVNYQRPTGVPNSPTNRGIFGKVGCISEPFFITGQCFIRITSKSYGEETVRDYQIYGSNGAEIITRATFQFSVNATKAVYVDQCGDPNPSDYDDYDCECTNGDEAINCEDAQGGICCIPKADLDYLCNYLNS